MTSSIRSGKEKSHISSKSVMHSMKRLPLSRNEISQYSQTESSYTGYSRQHHKNSILLHSPVHERKTEWGVHLEKVTYTYAGLTPFFYFSKNEYQLAGVFVWVQCRKSQDLTFFIISVLWHQKPRRFVK